uniref:Annexin n=1 Tax=Leptobrachium leishanense TaxID=445787 RepID=A0A8C5MQ99_9ANUR
MILFQQVQGTVFPNPSFDPMMDAQMIGGALQGFECDKDVLIDILTQRCNAQRMMIAQTYAGLYGRDLLEFLKEKLDGHFKDVIVGLMYSPPAYDAHELWHAMKGAGTEENCLIDILASRTTSDICQLKEAYTMRNYLNQEGYTDPGIAMQDAMALWEACQRRTGEHKNMLQMILCNKSHQQLFMGNRFIFVFITCSCLSTV